MEEDESLSISQNAVLLNASKPGNTKPRKGEKLKPNRIHSKQSHILHKENEVFDINTSSAR